MTTLSFEAYYSDVHTKAREKGIRVGQEAYNKLEEARPHLAEQVRGVRNLDPFYCYDGGADGKDVWENFVYFVRTKWNT